MGLPTSSDSSSASSSRFARIDSASLSRMALRFAGDLSAQRRSSNDARRRRHARSTSSRPPSATCVMTRPSRPAMSSNVRPDAAGNEPTVDEHLVARLDASRLGRSNRWRSRHSRGVPPDRTPRPGRAPRPGSVGTCRTPSASGPDRLGEEGVPPLRRPARRVVGELDVRAAADAGRDVEVGQQPEPVRPRVRCEPATAGECQLGHRPGAKHPAGQDDVLLVDVERVGVERRTATRGRSGSSRRRRCGRRDRRPAAPPVRAGPCRPTAPPATARRSSASRARDLAGRSPTSIDGVVSPAIRQPWLRSTMMAIESPTAARVAVTAARPSSKPAWVDRGSSSARKPFLAETEGRFGPLGGRQEHAARGVGRDRPSVAPPNSVATDSPRDLAGDVPQGRLEGPVATGVEVDRLEDPDVARDGQRILPDEQVLVGLEPVHRVARPDARRRPRRSRRARS